LFINAREGEVAAAGTPKGKELRALALSQSNRFVNKPSHSLLAPSVVEVVVFFNEAFSMFR